MQMSSNLFFPLSLPPPPFFSYIFKTNLTPVHILCPTYPLMCFAELLLKQLSILVPSQLEIREDNSNTLLNSVVV